MPVLLSPLGTEVSIYIVITCVNVFNVKEVKVVKAAVNEVCVNIFSAAFPSSIIVHLETCRVSLKAALFAYQS